MENSKGSIVLVMVFYLLIVANTLAQENIVPTMLNYQGFLTDQNGTALNGNYQITFALYSEPTGAASIVWDETHDAINIENGLFNVLLGSIDTITVDDLDGERYLGIRVLGEPEMTPRMRLASVAYSLRAEEANKLDNMDSKDFVAVDGDTMTGTLVLSNSDSLTPTLITNGILATTNTGLRVLKKTGNAWVYQPISQEVRAYPHWNSFNSSENNTGILELGYLVLNKKLYFGMLGGLDGDDLRVEIVDAMSGQIYWIVKMTATLNFFERKEIESH